MACRKPKLPEQWPRLNRRLRVSKNVCLQEQTSPYLLSNGFFPTAEAAIAAAVHTSACEGRTVPANEVEDLWKMVRGEISRQDLIKKYVAEALAKQEARDRV